MKNLTHTIRDILEGKQEDPNKEDLAKLKAVAKVNDEEEVKKELDEDLSLEEMYDNDKIHFVKVGSGRDHMIVKTVADSKKDAIKKMKERHPGEPVSYHVNEALEFGSDKGRDTYAKDTPGQSAGIDHNPEQHRHTMSLAVDGVPHPGGQIAKPDFNRVVKEDVEQVDEAGRWDETDQGRAYRSLPPEEKHRRKLKKDLERKSTQMKGDKKYAQEETVQEAKNCGCGKNPCETYGVQDEALERDGPKKDLNMKTFGAYARAVAKGGKGASYVSKKAKDRQDMNRKMDPGAAKKGLALSVIDREKARAKAQKNSMKKEEIFNSVLDNLIEKYNLGEAMSAAQRDAQRDAKGYKTSDDSHLDKDVKHKEEPKKRGRGERDLPHIATQLRGVVDMGTKHSGVKFKDGTTKQVHPDHAKSWLKKHDSSKPAQKLDMYKSADSHAEFMKHK